MKNVSDKPGRENQNTQFIFDYFFENRTVYEIMWKNVVGTDRQQTTVGRIPKATDIHSA
jgi:GTP-dependent phosphoenolpyruvate carboxykinase